MKKWLLMPLVMLLISPICANATVFTLTGEAKIKQERFWKENQKRYRKMVKKMDAKLKQEPYKTETFAEFVFLGLSYCFDKSLPYKESMQNAYAYGINTQRQLFPRLIDYEFLEKELASFHKKNYHYTGVGKHVDYVKDCQSVYNLESKPLRKKYEQIINNPKYRENWQFDY